MTAEREASNTGQVVRAETNYGEGSPSEAQAAHLKAVLQALLVTFLWATSWVFIKIGLEDIPALPFAGLRYTLAFLALLPVVVGGRQWAVLRELPRRRWADLLGLGLILYAVTQGAQFVALVYLPAATVSLLLSFTTIVVAMIGIRALGERPSAGQWLGIALYLAGALVYFYPPALPISQRLGLAVALLGVLANALSAILGRHINRPGTLTPATITVVSMGIGGLTLLVAGVAVQGLPSLSLTNWLIILWLAVVNSAFAFTLWNHTLRALSAVESSIINNTMMIQIPILAWVFLGERFGVQEGIGLALAAVGILVVQLRRRT